MEYPKAIQFANSLLREIQPYCRKVEIVGDIRRRCKEVKSIEILAVSREEEVFNLFGESVTAYLIIEDWVHSCGLNFAKNGAKYKNFIWNGDWINLYLTSPYQWGLHTRRVLRMALRTGNPHYASWLVTPKRKGGALPGMMCVKDEWLLCNNKQIVTQTEVNFYEAINVDCISKSASQDRKTATRKYGVDDRCSP